MKDLIELFYEKKGIIISWLSVLCIFIAFDPLQPLLALVDFGSDSY